LVVVTNILWPALETLEIHIFRVSSHSRRKRAKIVHCFRYVRTHLDHLLGVYCMCTSKMLPIVTCDHGYPYICKILLSGRKTGLPTTLMWSTRKYVWNLAQFVYNQYNFTLYRANVFHKSKNCLKWFCLFQWVHCTSLCFNHGNHSEWKFPQENPFWVNLAVASPEQNWRRVRQNYLRQSYVINSKCRIRLHKKKLWSIEFQFIEK